jgi:hypothetical protein
MNRGPRRSLFTAAPISRTGPARPGRLAYGRFVPQGLGDRSLREHLETLQVEPELRDWVEGMACLLAFGPLDQSAATEFFRTHALSGWSAAQALAALSATKLVEGTRKLIDSIAAPASASTRRCGGSCRPAGRYASSSPVATPSARRPP